MAILSNALTSSHGSLLAIRRLITFCQWPRTSFGRPQKCFHFHISSARSSKQSNEAESVPTVIEVAAKKESGPYLQGRKRRYTDAEDARLRQMRDEGHTLESIAKVLQRTIRSLEYRVTRTRIRKTNHHFTPEENEIILRKATQKWTWPMIREHVPHCSLHSLKVQYRSLLQPNDGHCERIGHAYTPAEDARLLELREKHMSFGNISKQLPGRTEHSLNSRYRKLVPREMRIKAPPVWTTEQREQIRDLRASGHTQRGIAAIVGRTRPSVQWQLRIMDDGKLCSEVIPRRRHWLKAEVADMLEMNARQCTIPEIGRALNRSWRSVESKLATLGLRGHTPYAVYSGSQPAVLTL